MNLPETTSVPRTPLKAGYFANCGTDPLRNPPVFISRYCTSPDKSHVSRYLLLLYTTPLNWLFCPSVSFMSLPETLSVPRTPLKAGYFANCGIDPLSNLHISVLAWGPLSLYTSSKTEYFAWRVTVSFMNSTLQYLACSICQVRSDPYTLLWKLDILPIVGLIL